MKIGVLVAMSKEMEYLKGSISEGRAERGRVFEYLVGKVGNNDVAIQQCGIGKVNSALGAAEMITRYNPDLVLSAGVAGSLSADVHSGETVMGMWYHYHDVYCGEEVAKGQVQGMPSTFSPLEVGVNENGEIPTKVKKILGSNARITEIVSGDQFVNDTKKRDALKEEYPLASAVDMESCSIAQTCYRYKVPFVSVRVISDGCDEEQYADFWEHVAKWSFANTKKILEELS